MTYDSGIRHRVYRPWGEFRVFADNERVTVKSVHINPYSALSLQYHTRRDQQYILMDSVYLEWSDEPIPDNLASPVEIMDWYKDHKQGDLLYSGKEIYFAKRVIHRATNYGTHPATFVEVAYGVNDEDDIVRLEDRYGRA